ncbi:MAG: site-specific integrase, partial [Croceibacterium sp.]
RTHDKPLYSLAVLALTTGARRGELCALRWQDIDLDGGTIRIERSLEQTAAGLVFRAPKTKKSRRSVTIPPSTVAELRAHRLAQQEQRLAIGLGRVEPDALVFAMSDGSPRRPNSLSNSWNRATAAAGHRINLHSLRHVHVSHLIAAGLDVLAISRRVGHASPTITLGRYGHLIPNADDRAVQMVEEMFRRVSGGNPVANLS